MFGFGEAYMRSGLRPQALFCILPSLRFPTLIEVEMNIQIEFLHATVLR